jgi:hypothetical protein
MRLYLPAVTAGGTDGCSTHAKGIRHKDSCSIQWTGSASLFGRVIHPFTQKTYVIPNKGDDGNGREGTKGTKEVDVDVLLCE